MFEYEIPFHIHEEIMKRLPVKSLVQFRSVSKAWKSLIDSPEFIAAHSLHSHTQPHHLLVSCRELYKDARYLSYIDDDTFPQQMSAPTVPLSVKQRRYSRLIGSSHGLICLYRYDPILKSKMVVLWNPSIGKSIDVRMPMPEHPFIAFGVCPVTTDPKIVTVTQSWDGSNIETSYRCKVMVYTLSSGKWRTLSTNLPTVPLRQLSQVTTTDRFIYLHVLCLTHYTILSFDLTNEKFEVIDLPESLATHELEDFRMLKIRESLAMVKYMGTLCSVWMTEDGAQRVFTKLFDIITLSPKDYIAGFRKNGIPIMRVRDGDRDDVHDDYEPPKLVYEPNSEHNNVIENSVSPSFFFNAHSYMETLLLLGQSDCSSYYINK